MLSHCGGCLASDRTLKPVTKHLEALHWLTGRSSEHHNKHISRIRFCWECSSLFAKLNDFRFKVNVAQSMLKRKSKGEQVDFTHLSNLNETPVKNDFDLLLIQEDDKLSIPVIKQEFDDTDYCDANYDCLETEYKSDPSDSEKVDDIEGDIKIERGTVKIIWDDSDGVGTIVDNTGNITDDAGNVNVIHDKIGNDVTISDKRGNIVDKNNLNLSKLDEKDKTIDKKLNIWGDSITISKNRKNVTAERVSNTVTIRDKKGNIIDKSGKICDETGNKGSKTGADVKINILEVKSEEVKVEYEPSATKEIAKPDTYKRKSCKGKRFERKCIIINYKKITAEDYMKYIEVSDTDDKTSKAWFERQRKAEPFASASYKCIYCMIMFTNEHAVSFHMKKRHPMDGDKYVCDICDRGFVGKSSLHPHLHTHKSMFKCKLCDEEFFLLANITYHLRKHSVRFQCPWCGLLFEWQREFYKHYNELHEFFVCDYCGKRTRQKKMMESHILTHTMKHCKICDIPFISFKGYVAHYKMKHLKSDTEGTYCVECDMQFDNMNRYKYHLRTAVKHIGKQGGKYPCPACKKVYAKKLTMKYHYDHYHLKQTKFYCQICDKYMLNPFRLRQHNATVHEKKKAPKDKFCDICGRGFSTRKILSNHRRTHTGERPYQCEYCSAAFAQKYAMTTHMRSQHKAYSQPYTGGREGGV